LSGVDELDHLDELRTRNIIREMVVDMKMHKHPSVATALLKAMHWTRAYNLISNPCVYQLMNEYLSPFVLLKKSRRNKHSIIPPRILKKLLIESELQVEKAQQMFESWSAIQLRLNQSISNLSSAHFNDGTYIDALNNDEQNELAKYHQTINKLRTYVFILVLSYTGMRYGEAIALPDDAALEREGEYYLKTLLSKTTDGTQCLEWIANKTTYDAVVLLSKINQIYRERAKLLLEHHSDALPCTRRINMQYGLSNRELFNVQQHKQSCQFTINEKLHKNGFSNINTLFSIPVTAEDIELLNRMTCNYQSVTHNHKGFRKPYQQGMLFNFSAHQFRHTFAWFIVANRLGDLDDIKCELRAK